MRPPTAVALLVLTLLASDVQALTPDDETIRDQFGPAWTRALGAQPVHAIALSPGGNILFGTGNNSTGPESGRINGPDGTLTFGVEHGAGINAVTLQKPGTGAFVGGDGRNVSSRDWSSGGKGWELPSGYFSSPVRALACSWGCFDLAVGLDAGGNGTEVLVFNLSAPPRLVRQFADPTAGVRALSFSANGSWLAGVQENDPVPAAPELFVWDLRSGNFSAPVRSLDEGAALSSVQFYPRDPFLLLAAGSAPTAEGVLFDLSTQPPAAVRTLDATGAATSLALSPDGMKVVIGTSTGAIEFFNLSTGARFASRQAHAGAAAVAWSDDGGSVVSGGVDGKIVRWSDLQSPAVVRVIVDRASVSATKRGVNLSVEFDESMQPSDPQATAGPLPDRTGLAFSGAWITPKRWNGSAIFPDVILDGAGGVRVSGARDRAGNPMAATDGPLLTVDTRPPACNIAPVPASTNVSTIRLKANASDPAPSSGIARLFFHWRTSNGSWAVAGNDTGAPFEWDFDLATDDVYYFAASCLDGVGNAHPSASGAGDTATVSDHVPPDSRVAPIARNVAAWNFTVDANGNDTGAGLASIDLWYRKDAGAWSYSSSDVSFPYSWDFDARQAGQGKYEFASRARDLAGNVETFHQNPDTWAVVDFGAPETTMEPLPAYSARRDLLLRATVLKPADGIATVRFDADDGEGWKEFQNDSRTAARFDAPADGGYSFRVRAFSVTGRAEPPPAGNDTFTVVDTRAPRTLSTEPANGSTGVPLSSPVKAKFDEPVERSSLLAFLDGKDLDGEVVWGAGDLQVELRPRGGLPAGARVEVALRFDDRAGNAGLHFFGFTTSELPPGKATLRVSVRDQADRRIGGAEVLLARQGAGTLQVIADAGGGAVFSSVEAGNYEVTVRHEGWIESRTVLALRSGETKELTVVLRPEPAGADPMLGSVVPVLLVALLLGVAIVAAIGARRKPTGKRAGGDAERAGGDAGVGRSADERGERGGAKRDAEKRPKDRAGADRGTARKDAPKKG